MAGSARQEAVSLSAGGVFGGWLAYGEGDMVGSSCWGVLGLGHHESHRYVPVSMAVVALAKAELTERTYLALRILVFHAPIRRLEAL